MSSTNQRGFHGFNNAPFLNRMPSKLLVGEDQNKDWGDAWQCRDTRAGWVVEKYYRSSHRPACWVQTCSRSRCSGTGCRACWCWAGRRRAWRWRWPRSPEPGWWRIPRRSPAGRRPENAAGGSGWTTSARSWRTTAEEEEGETQGGFSESVNQSGHDVVTCYPSQASFFTDHKENKTKACWEAGKHNLNLQFALKDGHGSWKCAWFVSEVCKHQSVLSFCCFTTRCQWKTSSNFIFICTCHLKQPVINVNRGLQSLEDHWSSETS